MKNGCNTLQKIRVWRVRVMSLIKLVKSILYERLEPNRKLCSKWHRDPFSGIWGVMTRESVSGFWFYKQRPQINFNLSGAQITLSGFVQMTSARWRYLEWLYGKQNAVCKTNLMNAERSSWPNSWHKERGAVFTNAPSGHYNEAAAVFYMRPTERFINISK